MRAKSLSLVCTCSCHVYLFVVPAYSHLSDAQAITQSLGQMWEGSRTHSSLFDHGTLTFPPLQQGLIVKHSCDASTQTQQQQQSAALPETLH